MCIIHLNHLCISNIVSNIFPLCSLQSQIRGRGVKTAAVAVLKTHNLIKQWQMPQQNLLERSKIARKILCLADMKIEDRSLKILSQTSCFDRGRSKTAETLRQRTPAQKMRTIFLKQNYGNMSAQRLNVQALLLVSVFSSSNIL